MSSTKTAFLFFMLVSYHIITTRNAVAEAPFTYEDLLGFTGGNFCGKNDAKLFEALCTHLAREKGITSYKSMKHGKTCVDQQLEIWSTVAEENTHHKISLLSCTFKAAIKGLNDNENASTIYSGLGKGQQGNDVAEYSLPYGTDKINWQPVAIRPNFYNGLVLFTYEDWINNFKGIDFCAIENPTKLFEKMCTRLAKVKKIRKSVKTESGDTCIRSHLAIWSSVGARDRHPETLLVMCTFKLEVSNGKNSEIITAALGRGRRQENDVVEYSYPKGLHEISSAYWQPFTEHANFLKGLI